MLSMKFEGGRELAAALAKLPERVSKKIVREALTDAAEPIQTRAGENAPREQGGGVHLEDEILIKTARVPGGAAVAVAIGPSKGTFYGGHLEFGTIKLPARPWFRPAFDTEHQKTLEIVSRSLWIALAAKGLGRTVRAPSLPTGPGRLV